MARVQIPSLISCFLGCRGQAPFTVGTTVGYSHSNVGQTIARIIRVSLHKLIRWRSRSEVLEAAPKEVLDIDLEPGSLGFCQSRFAAQGLLFESSFRTQSLALSIGGSLSTQMATQLRATQCIYSRKSAFAMNDRRKMGWESPVQFTSSPAN